jgi:hypothetical protein
MSTIQEQTTRTKSGRLVKKPERYVPVEKVEDDYATDEHDTDVDSDSSYDDDEEEESETEPESESEGSLVDFVVPDEEEDDSESE